MSVGLLLITHNRIGHELLATATTTLGSVPLACAALAISDAQPLEHWQQRAGEEARRLDCGEGVLVLTDIYGSTPSNIAGRLLANPRVVVVAGVSLPMLIRIFNYAGLGLAELANKAVSGGCEGIVLCTETPHGD